MNRCTIRNIKNIWDFLRKTTKIWQI
jgi:hypothetical protein